MKKTEINQPKHEKQKDKMDVAIYVGFISLVIIAAVIIAYMIIQIIF